MAHAVWDTLELYGLVGQVKYLLPLWRALPISTSGRLLQYSAIMLQTMIQCWRNLRSCIESMVMNLMLYGHTFVACHTLYISLLLRYVINEPIYYIISAWLLKAMGVIKEDKKEDLYQDAVTVPLDWEDEAAGDYYEEEDEWEDEDDEEEAGRPSEGTVLANILPAFGKVGLYMLNDIYFNSCRQLYFQLCKIIHAVCSSPQRKHAWLQAVKWWLESLQDGLKWNALMLILDVQTRWYSTHQMLHTPPLILSKAPNHANMALIRLCHSIPQSHRDICCSEQGPSQVWAHWRRLDHHHSCIYMA